MNRLNTIFTLLCCVFIHAAAIPPKFQQNTRELLRVLDREVSNHKKYEAERRRQIDSLKAVDFPSAENYMKIAEANRKFNLDSALVYYQKSRIEAIKESNDSLAILAALRRASLLPASGYFSEAERIFDSINPSSLPDHLRAEYFRGGNQLFFYAAGCVSDKAMANQFAFRAMNYTDSLLQFLDDDSKESLFYRAQVNMLRGNRSMAIADASEVLASTEETDDMYAISASLASYYYAGEKSGADRRIYYLILSAISDIKSGRHEMSALQELGKILYAQGDIERAERYMQVALELTLESGARMRIIESADQLPVISRASQSKSKSRTTALSILVAAMIIAVLLILWLLFKAYRSRSKLEKARENLALSLSVRDVLIKNVLTLCGECLNRLENFNRVASRKIKANQVTELHEMILSRKIVHDEFAKFLSTFDDTFLNFYPNFVNEVNDLLLPDKKYNLSQERSLTPELRILAFLRLGIDDSGAIAKFLDLSVNTVYTYRNKMKNRAVDRANFESKIRKP